jgi:subtilisin family serine protease
VVANGFAVSLPAADIPLLSRLPGVAHVYPSYRYRPLLDRSVPLIGAPKLWGTGLESAGEGVKIAIIDDGIDVDHPFFNPSGYTMPTGYPKGDSAYTTAKVIVARAFAPSGLDYANASLPFDPRESSHGIHVAGIAAGNANTPTDSSEGTGLLSGVAPRAYLGNYKALSIPTSNFGLNGNSPEIVAAIEAAVSDGMDVINLSLGEPAVDPSRDIVAKALDAASDAGVIAVAAAGNEFAESGAGSISSPGTSESAITVAASTDGRGAPVDRIAGFSSSGPTDFALRLKPDLSAPGSSIITSAPTSEGTWGEISGTSMSTPHVSGAAALLLQRHPQWSSAEVKSALMLTASAVRRNDGGEVSPLREGGGRIDIPAADQPLLFASPASISFGYLHRARTTERSIELSDAGDGTGIWQVHVSPRATTHGVQLHAPASVTVPGSLRLTASASKDAKEGDVDGFVVLERAGERRRIAFWLRLTAPQLTRKTRTMLRKAGSFSGSTQGRSSLVSRYLYPELVGGTRALLAGPEQVFGFHLRKPVENFGVVITSRAAGVVVTSRIVRAGDENRLAGDTTLPLVQNPYFSNYGDALPASAVLRPAPGLYDIVFDTPSNVTAGRFAFRFWVNDRTPPRIRLLSHRGDTIRFSITDHGSGVDPRQLYAEAASRRLGLRFDPQKQVASINVQALRPGRYQLLVHASDFQESKNTENASALLPNTSELRTTITIR